RPGGGRAVSVSREDGVGGGLARLELLLVRDDLQTQHLVARGHDYLDLLRVHIAAADVGHVEEDVGREARLYGERDGSHAPRNVHLPHVHHAVELGRDEQVRVRLRQDDAYLGRVAGAIALLIGDELYLALALVRHVSPAARAVHNPDVARLQHD